MWSKEKICCMRIRRHGVSVVFWLRRCECEKGKICGDDVKSLRCKYGEESIGKCRQMVNFGKRTDMKTGKDKHVMRFGTQPKCNGSGLVMGPRTIPPLHNKRLQASDVGAFGWQSETIMWAILKGEGWFNSSERSSRAVAVKWKNGTGSNHFNDKIQATACQIVVYNA